MEIAHRLGADIAINYKEESVQEYVQNIRTETDLKLYLIQ